MKMRQIPVLLLVSVLGAHSVGAQEFRSTISGRVLDPQQAVVPGASVTAVQVETGARHETVSGPDGQYTLPFVLPGTYRIVVEAPGFKRHVLDGVLISANERKAVDVQLEIGATAEVVEVTAAPPLLETSTGSIGQVVTADHVANIPLQGRSSLLAAQLWAGVTPHGGLRVVRPFDTSNTSNFSVSGAPSRSNELQMDGAPIMISDKSAGYNPPVDAVLEVRVEAFQADAAYGATGGGTVNLVSKAGTNQFHGSLYYYNQTSRLAATPFFNNKAGQPKPFMLWNQFGFTTGGPVRIPQVVDGRDKLFFYMTFEGIREPSPRGFVDTVPTEAMRRGDFSDLLRISANYQIYDPLTGVREGSRVRRQPFANNVIPTNRLNPIALNLLKYYPLPNQPGGVDGRNNYFLNTPEKHRFNNYMGRIDYNLGARHKLFWAFRHSMRHTYAQDYFQNGARGRYNLRDSWGTTVDDVLTLNPTTVVNTRLNWTGVRQELRLLSTGIDLAALGFPASIAARSPRPVMPQVEPSKFARLGDSNHNITPFDSFQIFSNVVKVLSHHSVKVGADLRLYRESSWEPRYSSGRYQFASNWTRGPLDTASTAPLGQELASMLLGLPTGGMFDLNASRASQAGYYAFFVQDDVRAASNLTLNLGLRWEKELPSTERFNRLTGGFDAQAVTAITAAAKAAYAARPIPEVPVERFNPVGGLLFVGPGNRSPYSTAGNFSPRFGFAWTPAGAGGRTVIRGGVGMFFFDHGITATDQTGFSQSTPLVATLDGYLTPYATLSNPFPDGLQEPVGSSRGVNTNLGQGISFYNRRPDNPYSLRWNLSVQRLLARDLVAEVGYLYNHAIRLKTDRQLNFTPAQYLSTLPVRDQATINYLAAQVPNPFAGLLPGTSLNGATIRRDQLLVAYPHFTGVTAQALNEGSTYSHMLLARVDKRMSGGLHLQANMQFSRIMERMERLNPSDPYLEKRVSPDDRPLRIVTTGTYQLPFGRGRRFGSGSRGVLNQLIGGWMWAGVFMWQSGPPLEWDNVIYLGGDLRSNPRNLDQAFDVTRFDRNPNNQLANNIRTFPSAFSNLRADRVLNVDFSVIKDFPIRERLKLQFRTEFFNLMNHPIFSAPDLSPTSSTFGQVLNQENLPRRIQMALRVSW